MSFHTYIGANQYFFQLIVKVVINLGTGEQFLAPQQIAAGFVILLSGD